MTEGPIVLADDEPQFRALLRFILSHNGFQVIEAEDGLEALLLVRQLSGKISLLVSDARMPKLDVCLPFASRLNNSFRRFPFSSSQAMPKPVNGTPVMLF